MKNHYVFTAGSPRRCMDDAETPLVAEMPTETTETTPTVVADGTGGRRRPAGADAAVVPDLR